MANRKEVSLDEFSDWKEHPVTQRLIEFLEVEFEVARINIVEKKGSVQERGECSIYNGAQADFIEGLLHLDVIGVNNSLYMEDEND